MELIRYNESIHSEVSIDKVVKKGIRKIYFVYEGRNAWWSTWVHTYKPGCMHTTLDSAQQYVEKNRKRGSVFYIEEIPALTLEGKFISLIISQINCQEVLENYKSKHKNPIKGLNTCHITTGASIYQAYKSFAFDSLFWYVPPPKENSVLIFASCLVPSFNGVSYSQLKEQEPWVKYYTEKPRLRTLREQKYKTHKRASLR